MNKYLIVFITLFLLTFLSFSQNTSTNSYIVGQGDYGFWVSAQNNTKQIKGSPYLFDNWSQKGDIFIGNQVYTLSALNYNIQVERFEVKISEDSVFVLNHGSFDKVKVKGKSFSRHLDPDFHRNTYFEDIIHFNDKYLLKKHELTIKESQINPLTMQKLQNDQYIKKEQYYILKDNSDKLDKIRLKKSTILSLVEENNKAKVKEFVKEHMLNYKKNDDVIKILNYCDTL